MKKGRQAKIKTTGQPAPRWPMFMRAAMNRIVQQGGFEPNGGDPIAQIAGEIVRHGEGEKFLKSVRRGRATQRQNLRFQLLRQVEAAIGAAVPRRCDDHNTPEAVRMTDAGPLFSYKPETANRKPETDKPGFFNGCPIWPPTPNA